MTTITMGGQDVNVFLVLKVQIPSEGRGSSIDTSNLELQYSIERNVEGLDLTDS